MTEDSPPTPAPAPEPAPVPGSLSVVVAGRVYFHVIAVAIIGGFSVLGWLALYAWFNDNVWYSDYVTSHAWVFPLICMPFSLLVGILVKHAQAPDNIEGSVLDSLTGDASKIEWRHLPATIAQSLASLWSGAVLGPEGGIGSISAQIAAFYNDKLHIPALDRPKVVFASISSAYNGLLENAVFTGVLGTELQNKQAAQSTLPANLLGGAIGYCIFLLLGGTGLANYLKLPPVTSFKAVDLLYVVLMALLGIVLAVITGLMMRVSAGFFGRFSDRIITRALIAGVIFSVVGALAPIIMFSGEKQVFTILDDPKHYGAALLVVMALGKLALLSVGFKSGFLGGPTFPAIFACVCIALALNIAFPAIPLAILIAGLLAGFLVLLFKAPFMVVLLTSFMLSASADLITLIVFAVATVLIVQPFLARAMAARQPAAPGSDPPATGSA